MFTLKNAEILNSSPWQVVLERLQELALDDGRNSNKAGSLGVRNIQLLLNL